MSLVMDGTFALRHERTVPALAPSNDRPARQVLASKLFLFILSYTLHDREPAPGAAITNSSSPADAAAAGLPQFISSASPEGSDSAARSSDTSVATSSHGGRQPLSRRGHFKSRMGCFNCKRRRVKCNELRPQCSPCRRLALDCSYPPTPTPAASAIRSNPSMLSMEDLRFYHQFITTAIPPLPLKADRGWMDCAAMSHEYDFLAHAVLGLGASHLTSHTNADFTSQALQHRLVAIKQVNEQLSNPPSSQQALDAILAALFCLITQASLIDDGLADYMTIIRGGHLIVIIIIGDMSNSVFPGFTVEGHDRLSAELSREDQRDDMTDMNEFSFSLRMLEPLLQAPYEHRYYGMMSQIPPAMQRSSLQAWMMFSNLFRFPATFSNEEFLELVNPENYGSRLLLIHMFLVDYVIAAICLSPDTPIRAPARKHVIIRLLIVATFLHPDSLRKQGRMKRPWYLPVDLSLYNNQFPTCSVCEMLPGLYQLAVRGQCSVSTRSAPESRLTYMGIRLESSTDNNTHDEEILDLGCKPVCAGPWTAP
ncbi:C6 transcription factor [Cordyceps militaris CM01]|uniref:C6 transcription factor n=1 Tax=Cordyceps militaris (strain CM01) TaxID=983644 RepID=G3JKT4_CORMM|nr:C6 transcription factor [Cordyceps militaris CM01]EGX90308.1 C6 transcription factor [Cordyceps militaris CM01]